MNEKDFRNFENFVKMTQPSLKKVMSHWLKEKYKTVIETKDYIYAVGDIPIALTAHLDTVFAAPVKDLFYDTRKNVIWSPDGLGADDRAGIFAIWSIVRDGMRPHIILCVDEERGCLGARELAKIPCPFEGIKYIVQLDRRGANDCVFYECDNPDFVKYIESFGFIEAFGTFTDITEYCPAWGVAGVNLSVGYYNEHSTSEILRVNALYATIEKVKKMLRASDVPEFKYIPCVYSYYNYDYWQNGQPAYNSYSTRKQMNAGLGLVRCAKCGELEYEEDMFPVKTLDGTTKLYCMDCLTEKDVEWCSVCYQAVEKEPGAPTVGRNFVCKDCEKVKGAN
jgi:hypothetical protein